MLLKINPVLPCKNVLKAIEFYQSRLGFNLLFSYPELPEYAGIGRDGIELHLQLHDSSEWDRVERPQFRFVVDDVDAIFEEFRASGAVSPDKVIRNTDWGTREFGLFDLNMNGLTFYVSV